MLRSPMSVLFLALAAVAVVGQVVLRLDPEAWDAALLWCAVGNGLTGAVIFVEAFNLAPRRHRVLRWPGQLWTPAGLVLGVQAAAVVLIAITSGSDALGGLLRGGALGALLAALCIGAGFIFGMLVVWPVILIARYLRTVMSAQERPDPTWPLVGVLSLSFIGNAIFSSAAVTLVYTDDRYDRDYKRFWGILFDYSSSGAVDQPLAWVARGFVIIFVATLVAIVVSGRSRLHKRAIAQAMQKRNSVPLE
jgi:hypothetical protein